jgi:hypothetical protein
MMVSGAARCRHKPFGRFEAMRNNAACRSTGVAMVHEYLGHEITRCEQDIKALGLQLSIDRDYVESPDAEPGEIDYYRLQVQLEQVELEFLNRRLEILKLWQP